MQIPDINTLATQDQARDLAIEWQHWASTQNLSYGELFEWQVFFDQVVEKYPDLAEEFIENAIWAPVEKT